jgi:hypothetical protein
VLGPKPRFYIVVSGDAFSNRIHMRFLRSHAVTKRLDSHVIKSEQKVGIKFLRNESIDSHENHTRLSAQFGEQIYALRTIQFWCAR